MMVCIKNIYKKSPVLPDTLKVSPLEEIYAKDIPMGEGLILVLKTSEIHRNQSTHSRLLHRYSIYNIHRTHGHFIVGYNDEL